MKIKKRSLHHRVSCKKGFQNMYRIFVFIPGIFFAFLFFTACGENPPPPPPPVNLTYWSVFDDKATFDPLIKAYTEQNKNVNITYKKFKYSEYEDELINAFSLDKGPDIFSIHNDWLPRYQERLAAFPPEVLSASDFESSFVEVASKDLVSSGKAWAVPLSVDTLALYYNKDHFDQANIPEPPKTWEEFEEDVKELTKTDTLGNITRAGAAMGTSENVNRSVDIVSLLMLQNNAQMIDDNHTRATFDQSVQTDEGEVTSPGQDALRFYTDFAAPSKELYTWNPKMDYSIDAFTEGGASMMINYSFHAATIKAKAPDLNFGITQVPQYKNKDKVNYANYWAEAVSNKSRNQEEAWKFLKFISEKAQIETYSETTGRPTSRRDMVNDQLQNPNLMVFADQLLTAESWYKPDAIAVENIFVDMISSVNLGSAKVTEAIPTAVKRINQLFPKE